ncbi:MAG: hypothetical protein M3343_07105 [Actinomycetota bacterium]|nr:hypothetical protein [Actinomycetota bacterium]
MTTRPWRLWPGLPTRSRRAPGSLTALLAAGSAVLLIKTRINNAVLIGVGAAGLLRLLV